MTQYTRLMDLLEIEDMHRNDDLLDDDYYFEKWKEEQICAR